VYKTLIGDGFSSDETISLTMRFRESSIHPAPRVNGAAPAEEERHRSVSRSPGEARFPFFLFHCGGKLFQSCLLGVVNFL